jgi:cysteine dioxygenase
MHRAISCEEMMRKAFEKLTLVTKGNVYRKVRQLKLDINQVNSILSDPREKPYGRKYLFKNDNIEVIAMTWAPHASCLPHDHGESSGWVKVILGEATHKIFSSDPLEGATHEVRNENQGDIFYAPSGMLHEMGNASGKRLVTLHFYFPPISGMQVFDQDQKRSCIVNDECGAWWPDPEQLVKITRHNNQISFSNETLQDANQSIADL